MDNAAQKQRLHDRGICVVIPTYNNAGTIVDVVARTLGQCRDVIVVCDGCTDDTVPRLQKMPELPVIIELNDMGRIRQVMRQKNADPPMNVPYSLQGHFSSRPGARNYVSDMQNRPTPVLDQYNASELLADIQGLDRHPENPQADGPGSG